MIQGGKLEIGRFNPRTPCGVRPVKAWAVFGHEKTFQSTHPVWGATIASTVSLSGGENFNPRTPCGVRRPTSSPRAALMPFQSTHPVWGATGDPVSRRTFLVISIHAPRVGCDGRTDLPAGGHSDFNPRTPCGVRLLTICMSAPSISFQSTHPVWGATIAHVTTTSPSTDFNPRTPCGVRPRPP